MPNKMERFSQRARRVLSLAQEESEGLNHSYIGTEHLLLALMAVQDGVASSVLRDLNVEPQRLKELVEQLSQSPPRQPHTSLDLSPGTKRVLELAVDEARRLGHHYLGTEHLLLGLVRQEDSVATNTLRQLNITPDDIRRQTRRVLQERASQSQPQQTETTAPEKTTVNIPPPPLQSFARAYIQGGSVSQSERTRILDMLDSGKINPAEAAELLRALQPNIELLGNPSTARFIAVRSGAAQHLHMLVTDKGSNEAKLDIVIPLERETPLNLIATNKPVSIVFEDDIHRVKIDVLKDEDDKP